MQIRQDVFLRYLSATGLCSPGSFCCWPFPGSVAVLAGLSSSVSAARFRSTRRTSSSTAPACRASSAHWARPGQIVARFEQAVGDCDSGVGPSRFVGSTRSRPVCRPPLRSIVASMSRAWWHHTACPRCVRCRPDPLDQVVGGRRRARPPGRRSTHPPPSRPAPHLSRHPNDHPRQPPTHRPGRHTPQPRTPHQHHQEALPALRVSRGSPAPTWTPQPGRRRQPRPATPAPRAHPG